MKPSLKNLAKLAYVTRRWDRYRRPVAHWFGRWLVGFLCGGRGRRPVGRLVMPYDRGMINVDVGTEVGYKIMFFGYHDAELARLIAHATSPGSTCIDVGANIGAYTLVMAFSAGREGRVIALEPNPEVASALLENIALNSLSNVEVVRAAVADSDGETVLYSYEPDAPNRMVSSLRPSPLAHRRVTVRAVSGRSLLETLNITSCDVIKIDAMGADLMVLRELSELIELHRPRLFVEYRRRAWSRFGADFSEALRLFRSWDYTLYVVARGLTRPFTDRVPDACNLLCIPRGKDVELGERRSSGL